MATTETKAPELVLLCMGSCHGEFYLPLDAGEPQACPNDPSHPFAVYEYLGTVRPLPDEDEDRVWKCETCDVLAIPSPGYTCWDAGHSHVVVKPMEGT